jgi:hypothetical protein
MSKASFLGPIEGRSNPAGDELTGASKGIRIQMGISSGCRGLGVPVQLSDNRQAQGRARADGCKGVAQIMKPHAFQTDMT